MASQENKELLQSQLETWQARANAVQLAAAKLQAESELLKYQANECQQNIARLQKLLAPSQEAQVGDQEKVGDAAGAA